MKDKIPLDQFAREQAGIPEGKEVRACKKHERDRYYMELGRAYSVAKWLHDRGFIRVDAEP